MRPSKRESTPRRTHRRSARLAVVFLAFISGVFFTSSAQATIDLAGHFAESGQGDGQFNTARAIAVNETGNGSGASAGDLYILDGGYEQRINQFEEDGHFVRTFGWGVQDGSDEFQICTSGCHGAVYPSAE